MILNLQKFLDTLQAKYPTAVDGGGFGQQVAPVAMCLLDLGGKIQVFDPTTQAIRDIESGDIPTPSVTSVNGLAVTASTGTLTIANGKTLTASNTLTFTGTDGITVAFGGGLSIAAAKVLTVSNTLTISGTDGSTLAIGTGGTLGTAAFTAATAYATAAQGTLADNAQPAALALSNLAAVTPAGDNTYNNPTSITIQAGLITAIT